MRQTFSLEAMTKILKMGYFGCDEDTSILGEGIMLRITAGTRRKEGPYSVGVLVYQ